MDRRARPRNPPRARRVAAPDASPHSPTPPRGARTSRGLAHRRHVEVRHADRRHRRTVEELAEFPADAAFRGADLGEAPEQLDGRLVEPEVVDRAGYLAMLDEIDTVTRQT